MLQCRNRASHAFSYNVPHVLCATSTRDRHSQSGLAEDLRIMAAKTGQAIKHNAPRGRELSGTHDYQQRRQSSGKKVLTSQEERPWLFSSSRSMLPEQLQRSGKKVLTSQEEYPRFFSSSRTMLPEQLSRPGQGRVRSKVQYKIPNYDLFGANSSNRSAPQYLSRSHDQHLLDSKLFTKIQKKPQFPSSVSIHEHSNSKVLLSSAQELLAVAPTYKCQKGRQPRFCSQGNTRSKGPLPSSAQELLAPTDKTVFQVSSSLNAKSRIFPGARGNFGILLARTFPRVKCSLGFLANNLFLRRHRIRIPRLQETQVQKN